ncbi:MAG: four helix bundle protein [Candidatus Pacebacteria bacterium]|nr:four helix bundle protein [Candidatus Paceibacterota bacterium]
MYTAYSSGGELETQIEIAKRLPGTRNLKYDTVEELLTEVMKMLYAMINNRKDVSKTKR